MSLDLMYEDRVLQPTRLSVSRNLFGRSLNCDRYIPSRANNNWETNFSMIPDNKQVVTPCKKNRENGENVRDHSVYNILLRNEILGERIHDIKTQCDDRLVLTPTTPKNLFRYGTPRRVSEMLTFY